MHRNTVVLGTLMIILGVVAYFASGMASATALIPAFFGLPIAALGLLAARARRGALIAVTVLAVLGALGPLGRIIPMATQGNLQINAALLVQAAFMLLALVTAVLAIRALRAP
jgi:hypothetical protein